MKETNSNDSDATPNVSLNEELNQLAVFQETISPREGIRNVHPELEVAAIESDQVDFVIFLSLLTGNFLVVVDLFADRFQTFLNFMW